MTPCDTYMGKKMTLFKEENFNQLTQNHRNKDLKANQVEKTRTCFYFYFFK